MVIYPDSNSLFGDWRLSKPYSLDFLKVLEDGVVEVGLSPVVVAETKRHASREAETALNGLRRSIRSLSHNWDAAPSIPEKETERIESSVRQRSEDALGALLRHGACRVLEWTEITAKELVERELAELRPVKLSGDQSIGLRDVVIWHTVLDHLDTLDEDDRVILVTQDDGFLTKKKALHPHLVNDLRKRGIDPERVSVEPDLVAVTLEAQKFRQLLSTRDAEAREFFLDYVRSFSEQDWSEKTADLDWSVVNDPNDFYNMDGIDVVAADIEDIETEVASDSVLCAVTVELTFEGSMEASEYFSGEFNVEWHGGELGEPYLLVATSRRVRFEADVRIEADAVHLAFESIDWATDD